MKKFAPALLILCALVTILLSFFGDDSYRGYHELADSVKAQGAANEELRDQVNQLKRQVYGMQSDPRILEKAARNELGLARPNEYIFIFDDKAKH